MDRPHGRHGTRSRRAAAGLAAAALLAIGVLAAGALGGSRPVAAADPSGATVTAPQAAALYRANCATCHGPAGEGTAAGPSLVGVGAASVDFYLRTGRMPLGAPGQRPQPQEPAFSEAQIRGLVDHVVGFGGNGPPIPAVTTTGDVHEGWRLYAANCAACHAATGAGNAVGGGSVAVGLGRVEPVEIAEAMVVGPGAMPAFGFSQDERDAIIAYVAYLQAAEAPGGAAIGGFGPVAEGFVAVFIGLTLLVVVALFVGRRTHAGEPPDPIEPADPAEPRRGTA